MQGRPFTLIDATRGILRRKTKVLLFFCVTVVAVGGITLIVPKSYTSDARLFLRLGRENAAMDATATLGEHPVVMMPQSREAEINSVVELLQSKQLYETVVDTLGAERILKADARPASGSDETQAGDWLSSNVDALMAQLIDWGIVNDLPIREKAVIKLRKKTDIAAFEKSNVITVAVESHSPALAQEAVGALIDAYVHQHLQLHRSPGAFEFLRDETLRIESQLLAKQTELEYFKNRSGILAADVHRNVLIERIAKLQADLLQIEAEHSGLLTEVDSLQNELSQLTPIETTAQTVGAGNEGVDGMRQELYKLELLREQLAAKYDVGHPNRQQVEQQLALAQAIFNAEELKRTEIIRGPNKVYQEASLSLVQKKPQLAASQARKAKLVQQIDDFHRELVQFTHSESELVRLEREVSILDANYRKYAGNLEQAKIDGRMEDKRFSNVGVAQPAALNLKPSSPNKLLNLAIALILGTCGGCALAVLLEYFYPTLVDQSGIEQQFASRVLVTIPNLSPSEADLAARYTTTKKHRQRSPTS